MHKKIMLLLLAALLLLVALLLYRTFAFSSKQIPGDGSAAHIEIIDAVAERLSKAVQLPTISFEERERFDSIPFLQLHELIKVSFPLVDSLLQRTIVNDYSLMYEWKGTNPELQPVILLAHQDVVPIEEVTIKDWLQLPFSGKITEDAIWGRGTLDDKSSIFGMLEAAEMLLEKQFQPERTLFFVFGHDEEIGGEEGAKKAAEILEQRNIKAAMVLDEGLFKAVGSVPGVDKPVALIGIAEKGFMTLELTSRVKGGHSSIPARETSIGVLCKAIVNLQENLLEPNFTESMRQFFEYVGPEMPFALKMITANQWLFEKVLINEMSSFPEGSACFRTTSAPTMIRGGIKENVIPYEAKAWVNFRILQGEHSHDVIDRVKKIINDERIHIEVANSWVNEPSPVADINHPAFQTIVKTIGQVSKEETLVSPSLVLGGTDSKHFRNVSKNVLKYMHVTMNSDDIKRVHGTNERILIEDYKEMIRFFYQLMRNVQEMEDPKN